MIKIDLYSPQVRRTDGSVGVRTIVRSIDAQTLEDVELFSTEVRDFNQWPLCELEGMEYANDNGLTVHSRSDNYLSYLRRLTQ